MIILIFFSLCRLVVLFFFYCLCVSFQLFPSLIINDSYRGGSLIFWDCTGRQISYSFFFLFFEVCYFLHLRFRSVTATRGNSFEFRGAVSLGEVPQVTRLWPVGFLYERGRGKELLENLEGRTKEGMVRRFEGWFVAVASGRGFFLRGEKACFALYATRDEIGWKINCSSRFT